MNELAGRIQDAELEIMRVLWEAGKALPLAEIRAELSKRRGWEDSTIKTLLRRLCAKEVVRLERRGVYSAIVTEREYGEYTTGALIDKVYGGSAIELVASLVSDGRLCREDVEELRAMFRVEVSNE